MNCGKVKMLLLDYYEDSLDENEKESVERHLEFCPKCKQELLEIKKTFDLLGSEKEEKPEKLFWTNFLPLVTEKIASKKADRKSPVFKPQLVPLAVSFLAFLVIGTFLFTQDFWREVALEKKTITFYPLYSYGSPEEELVSTLPSEETISLPLDLLEERDEENLTFVQNALEEEYWEKEDVSEILEDLSPEQLKVFEKRLNNIKI